MFAPMQVGTRGARRAGALQALVAAGVLTLAPVAGANGLGENSSWQFQTTQDKVNKGAVVDLIERKKGGFYDSYSTTVNNNTYIDKQFNCSLTATSAGNSGSNALTGSASSPTASATGTTSSNTQANTATNGVSQAGLTGVLTMAAANTQPPTGSLTNDQSNTGALNSSVNGSNTNSSTGAINAGGGTNTQTMTSTQSNGGQQNSSVANSTACQGPLVTSGPLN